MLPRLLPRFPVLAGCLLLLVAAADPPRPDLVVADFEGDAYGPGWRVEGTAFGAGPARGTLPGQMHVDGFEGRGLVNSYVGGDDAEGTLTSPPFRIDRRYLNFLLGGGWEPDLLQVALVVDGQPVRTATGPNDSPGGSERLAGATWDVAEFAGKDATLRITDRRKGGWGHISLDQVTQSDARRQAEPAARTVVVDRRYLHLPVDPKAPVRRVQVATADGQVVRDFDIRLGARAVELIVEDFAPKPVPPPFLPSMALFDLARPVLNLLVEAHLPLPTDRFFLRRPAFLADALDRSVRPAEVKPPPARDLTDPSEFVTFLDLSPFREQALRITTADLPDHPARLNALSLSDKIPGAAKLYHERDRPRFHFTSRRGWLNDPNGLVWHKGQYHLYYQHNPYGWDWGNMHWGHAISPDLVHWTEQPIALYPKKYGDWAFSGSAVVDHKNLSGFGTADDPPLVAAYTSTGRGECIISSRDGGMTWAEFAGNPVVRHEGRDPRLLWHELTKRWVMAVYDEADKKEAIVFHSSPDLKTWTYESRIDGFFECPDLFELPVEGAEPARSLWVLSAADGKYRLGQFDGRKFTPETPKLTLWHGDFYAAQTFSNAPDGRRIQVGWGRNITFPGMPFNQQMAVPCELTLRATPDGPRLFAKPVAEVARLRPEGTQALRLELPAGRLDPAQEVAARRPGSVGPAEAVDVVMTLAGDTPGGWSGDFFGARVRYDEAGQLLDVADLVVPLQPVAGKVKLRILADRRSLEVFANDGAVAVSRRIAPRPDAPALEHTFRPHPRQAREFSYEEYPLNSAW